MNESIWQPGKMRKHVHGRPTGTEKESDTGKLLYPPLAVSLSKYFRYAPDTQTDVKARDALGKLKI